MMIERGRKTMTMRRQKELQKRQDRKIIDSKEAERMMTARRQKES